MSTLKTDNVTAKSAGGDLSLDGDADGVVNLGAGFKVNSVVGVPTASIQDDAVTLAKVADDAIGVAQLSATGTASSSVFLRGDNAWASAGGGAWNLIGTQVASGSASLTQTGLSSTYDTYAIALSDLNPATDAVQPYLRLGDSSGIDSGATDYDWSLNNFRSGNVGFSAEGSEGAAQIKLSPYNVGNAATEGTGGIIYLHSPSDGTMLPNLTWHICDIDNFNRPTSVIGSGAHASAITLDRVQFLFSSGNIDTGRMTVWGISHA